MIEPVRLTQPDPTLAVIQWKDGLVSQHRAAELRRECPCASCVDEFTGKQLLDPAAVPDDLRIVHVEVVGRYALRFRFSDMHDTGLYTFAFLRDLAVRSRERSEG